MDSDQEVVSKELSLYDQAKSPPPYSVVTFKIGKDKEGNPAKDEGWTRDMTASSKSPAFNDEVRPMCQAAYFHRLCPNC